MLIFWGASLVLSSQWAEGSEREPVSKNKVRINWGIHLVPSGPSGFLFCHIIFPSHFFSLYDAICHVGPPKGSMSEMSHTGAWSSRTNPCKIASDGRSNFFSKWKLLWKMTEQLKPWQETKGLCIKVQMKTRVNVNFYQHYPVIMSLDSKEDSPERLWTTSGWVQTGTSLLSQISVCNRRNHWPCVLSEYSASGTQKHTVKEDSPWILSSCICIIVRHWEEIVTAALGHLSPALLGSSL